MEKIKALFEAVKAKFGVDVLIAAAVIFGLLLIHPALAVVGGIGFVLYKTGKLDKLLSKFRKE